MGLLTIVTVNWGLTELKLLGLRILQTVVVIVTFISLFWHLLLGWHFLWLFSLFSPLIGVMVS